MLYYQGQNNTSRSGSYKDYFRNKKGSIDDKQKSFTNQFMTGIKGCESSMSNANDGLYLRNDAK